MQRCDRVRGGRRSWPLSALYDRFEQVVIVLLTALIGVVVLAVLGNLVTEVFTALVLVGSFDPTDHAVFQRVLGMIFTVIIALEFKRSIRVVAERRDGIVPVKMVILLAMLAVVRKVIILDFPETPARDSSVAAVAAMGRRRRQRRLDVPRPSAPCGSRHQGLGLRLSQRGALRG
ncbi:MAG: phosphate-starvation-inducible PsiE family protein [Alphaproteobacteria bacterium]